jgi:hypothetical protein
MLSPEYSWAPDRPMPAVVGALLVGPLGTAMHAAWAVQRLRPGVRRWEAARAAAPPTPSAGP